LNALRFLWVFALRSAVRVNRLAKIAAVFTEEGLGYLTGFGVVQAASGETTVGNNHQVSSEIERARRLRRCFERLGPTFVKFGQMLANRVDLFSDNFILELSKLHADVTPFDHQQAIDLVENELGTEISEVFSEFSEKPVASASIAQVYRARLKDTGEEVAVKVQRPNLEESLLEDLQLIVQMSSWLDALVPSYRRTMMHVVAKEYVARSKTEIDFTNEATALQEFYDLFVEDDYVSFPRPYLRFSTDKIIVMEWVEGPRLGDINHPSQLEAFGFCPEELVQNLTRIQLTMSYEHGLIHADMHPGNIILRKDKKLGVIDCGLHARVPKKVREAVLNMLLLQSQGRVEGQVEIALELSPPAERNDLARFRQELIEHYSKTPARSATSMSEDIIATMRIGTKYRNYANPYLLMIVRNALILEGIFLKFAPAFDPNDCVGGYVKDILMRRFLPQNVANTFTPLLGELAIALHNRPELVSRIIRLESKFIQSPSLGEFLRSENVINEAPKPTAIWVHILLGVALGGGLLALGMQL